MQYDIQIGENPPWADILITALYPFATSVVLTRLVDGAEAGEVRGSSLAQVSSRSVRILDYDIPVGRIVSWRVDQYATIGGVLLVSEVTPAHYIPPPPTGMCWLSDPLNPTRSILVRMLSGTDTSRELAAPITVAPSATNPLPLGIATRVRQAPTFPLQLDVDAAEVLEVEDILAPGTPILFRPGPEFRHRTGIIHLAVTDARIRRRLYDIDEWEIIDLQVTEVRGPGVQPGTGFRVWEMLKAEAATWGDLQTRYQGSMWRQLDRGL